MTIELVLKKVGFQVFSTDGNHSWLLKDISLICRSKERIGLIGRNGSGKTTLARLLSGLERPTEGRFYTNPKNARIVLVLQRPEDHFIHETVGKQIASYARRKPTIATIYNLLAKVGLPSEFESLPPRTLSGGHQRLVAIACALAANASFLVLDEPLAGLDSYSRQLVTQVLIQLNSDKDLGLIVISHHPDDLLGLVERLWILDEGRLVHDGPFSNTPTDILDKCLSPNDPSLFYLLRQLESRGINLPKTVYSKSTTPEEISKFLSGG